MTVGLLILEGLTLLGAAFLAYSLARSARNERQEHARIQQATLDSHLIEIRTRDESHRNDLARMAREHRAEVQTLLQRIQAPEAAVVEHQQNRAGKAEHVLPLTDAEAASREDELRAAHIAELERIEALETEGFFP